MGDVKLTLKSVTLTVIIRPFPHLLNQLIWRQMQSDVNAVRAFGVSVGPRSEQRFAYLQRVEFLDKQVSKSIQVNNSQFGLSD